MTKTIGWKFGCTRLPAKTDRAAKLTVPKPTNVSGQPLDRLTVRQNYRRSFGFSINLFGKEARAILSNSGQMLTGGFGAAIVRRPALLKRLDVTGQVLFSRPDEVQRFDRNERKLRTGGSTKGARCNSLGQRPRLTSR